MRLEPEFEMVAAGKGFVGIIDDTSPKQDHINMAKEAVRISNEKIQSGKYDIVILDEINYAVNLELITVRDVLRIIDTKPEEMDLILTGNHAKREIHRESRSSDRDERDQASVSTEH